MKQIVQTRYDSIRIGPLPKGCQQCVRGEKTVMFITGICPCKCFYCPISDQKNQKDVIYANEWQLKDIDDKNLFKEIELTQAKGAGITGGDPLARLERTLRLIHKLKKRYGKHFHIHLYTPLALVTEATLKKLEQAGLDEIRFHPDLESDKQWHKLKSLDTISIKKGIEIPVIPGMGERTIKLIDTAKQHISFINLNELELSDTNASYLVQRGYKAKDDISYGVKDSEQLAKKLLRYIQTTTSLNAHYCSTRLKDRHQLGNRLKRRAKNIKRPYDTISEDGMLIRAAIYKNLPPKKTTQQQEEALKRLLKNLKKQHDIPSDLMEYDKEHRRILTAPGIAQELKDDIKSVAKPVIVVEYPTQDGLIVELEPI